MSGAAHSPCSQVACTSRRLPGQLHIHGMTSANRRSESERIGARTRRFAPDELANLKRLQRCQERVAGVMPVMFGVDVINNYPGVDPL
jgi:hypothetical protein